MAAKLPTFPWDTLNDAKAQAGAHPDGVVDLSVGTPVDPAPALAQDALVAAADAHGYPTVWGTPQLRSAIVDYTTTRWGAVDLTERHTLPVIGTKEFIAALPFQLGLGPDDLVVLPTTAYPTYDVGARLAGCRIQQCDDPDAVEGRASLIWINSPANPHGAILSDETLAAWIARARADGAILASDECYGEFGWDGEPASVLRADLCEGSAEGLLVVGSLSKRSNMAGYRAGYVVGDSNITSELLNLRRHTGYMVPAPIQAAMAAALGDQTHVEQQRNRYIGRRQLLCEALTAAGFRIDHSEGSLYLWATRGENCRATLNWLAQRGILVAPGDFYGTAGTNHVRISLTATDTQIEMAAARLTS